MTIRNLALSLLALLALLAGSVSFTSTAVAYDRTQGGVIPGSADDYRFVQGRGWVPNARPARVIQSPRRHGNAGNRRGHSRAAAVNRSRGTIVTATAFRNITVRQTGWAVAAKTGVGRSVPPTDSSCFTLPSGIRRCPNR